MAAWPSAESQKLRPVVDKLRRLLHGLAVGLQGLVGELLRDAGELAIDLGAVVQEIALHQEAKPSASVAMEAAAAPRIAPTRQPMLPSVTASVRLR